MTQDIKTSTESAIRTAIKKVSGLSVEQIHLEHPAVETHGDYSSNVAMATFEQLHASRFTLHAKNPRQLAEAIVVELQKDKELQKIVDKIAVAGPGFINFFLKHDALIQQLEEVVNKGEKYGSSDAGKKKTFVIDYSSPNIAKRFAVGHLRSTIIGQAIYNLYKFLGWNGIGDNHIGDWGTQFGKMIVAIKKWAGKSVDDLTIDEMESLYVKFHQEAEQDKLLDEKARRAFKNLEDGRAEERAMWKKLVDRSLEEFQKIYDLLNVKIDVAYGESFYEAMMPTIIEEAKRKGVAVESKGALIIPYPNDALPPSMLLKSDGATTYFTRDLATIKFRKEKWNPELMIYEVGAEQTLHFRQVFWAVELLLWAKREDFVHIPHGLVRLKEGKMSTRKGNVIKLEQVLEEAINRAKKFNADSVISTAVGIGAVKYNDLKHAPSTGYAFDWEEMITLDGNSGPYLQYTFARTRSVLAKARGTRRGARSVSDNALHATSDVPNAEELAILRWIYRFPEVVMSAAKNYAPNEVCTFLYELAQRYNTFYNKHRILDSVEDAHVARSAKRVKVATNFVPPATSFEQRQFRLALTFAVGQVLENGLRLLGIQAPEKM